jgi:prephenate dehydrogenase
MFVDLLLGSGAQVCVVEPGGRPATLPAGCAFEQADVTYIAPGLAAQLRDADIVVLAVREQVALDAVKGVAAALAPGALLVDTLSVKKSIVRVVRAHAPRVEAVSLNPMFAPSLGMDRRPVAAVVVRAGPRSRQLLDLLERRGARVVRLSEDEHDRLAGAVQALTHATVLAFGLALADLGLGVAETAAVAPPPHLTLLALLARITGGTDETYWEIQAANPQAAPARAALVRGAHALTAVVDDRRRQDFATVFAEIRDLLDGDLDNYRELCGELFRALHPPDSRKATP